MLGTKRKILFAKFAGKFLNLPLGKLNIVRLAGKIIKKFDVKKEKMVVKKMTALEKMKRYQSAFAALYKIRSLALDLKLDFQEESFGRVYCLAENTLLDFAKKFAEKNFEDD